MKTFYVRLSHRWVSRPAPGHWVPAVFVSDDPASRHPVDGDVALFEVQCRVKSEAEGIVTHWLAKGRPQIMTVREIKGKP